MFEGSMVALVTPFENGIFHAQTCSETAIADVLLLFGPGFLSESQICEKYDDLGLKDEA